MKRIRTTTQWSAIAPALAGACALMAALPAFSQQYHSNDITPAGSASGRLNASRGGKQVGAAQANNFYSHAVLMSGNALTAIDLNPPNYYYSMAMCNDDTQQGGWGYSMLGGIHAIVWSGSADTCVDLNPSGYSFSYCLGISNGEQVGYAQNQSYFVTASHAYSWHGSAASGVDLHPSTLYPFSRALGVCNGEEVGYVSSFAYPDGDSAGYHTTSHAIRWSGTAASAIDLNPLGYDASEATCTSGTQQGGWAYMASLNTQHAMIWSGDANSAVDLHPAGYTDSKVTAIFGNQQVGEGWNGPANAYGSIRHALLWTGTRDSVVDLNQYLPAGYTNAVATGIDVDGNVVGYAYNGTASGLSIPTGAVAVVFAPGAAPIAGLASITLSSANVAPGDSLDVSVALAAAAPVGGVNIDFLSTATTILATPASYVIPEGSSNATFTVVVDGAALTVPTSFKLYASDGSTSRSSALTVTPVVKLGAVSGNPVEGGFSTYGSVSLNIPAQLGGATVTLASGDPTLVGVPASVTLPQGYTTWTFSITTAPVSAITSVPITATLNGSTIVGSVTLSPAPVISLTSVSAPEVVGGQLVPITITLNNFPRSASGATVSLSSGDIGTLQVPATATVPQGAYSVTVTGASTVVSGRKGVSVKAVYNGSTFSATVFVNPIPTVTITQADYLTDTKMLKISATTTFTNAVLTYGGSPDAAPFGTMQFEQGVFKGSIILDTPPAQATVWNSLGGQATVPVNIKTSSLSGGGGGGGGGGSTATTYKLTIATNGKGTVTTNPSGTSFAAGTVVTLTATPAVGSPWIGWSGAITGTQNPITITINKDTSVTANFR